MAYLKELIDRLGKALGFTSRSPEPGVDHAPAPPAGLGDAAAQGGQPQDDA